MASEMLLDAAVFSPSWATKLRETARPALSSAGEVIFEPEDKRASDCCSAALDWLNNVAVFIADVFVLTTIPIIYSFRESPRVGLFLLTQHPCCVDRSLFRHPSFFPPAVCGCQKPLSNWLSDRFAGT